MDVVSCPLLTARHAHHSAVWCVTGYSFPKLCIACATERLENHSKGELSIHIKKILGEFQALLSSAAHACNSSEQSFFSVLSTDSRVVEHLCGLLFGLLQSQDATLAQSSLEVLMTLLGLVKTQDISRRLLQKTVQSVLTSPNLPSSLPHLTLLGRLLHSHSALTFDLLHSYGSLLDFLLNGLSYPDEKIKSSVVYLLVQVAGKTPPTSLPLSLVQRLARHISTNLATAKSHDLTINLLGLVRHLLKSDSYTQCLIQADRLNADAKGSTFASAFKRVLLSQDELLQLSGVQCIGEVLTSHPDYGRTLLNADIAEFLFEALSSKNELLINSLFNCLNSLAGIDEFYTKYHVVYGMEPILTGLSTLLRLRNHGSAQSGITLLTKILTRQPRGVSLFCSPALLHDLLDLLTSLLEVECLATPTIAALSALISSQHVPSGSPLLPFLTPLAHLLSLVHPLTSADDTRETTVDFTASTKNLICSVFQCFSRVCRLVLEGCVVCVDRDFLLSAMRESLLPMFLLHLDHFDTPGPSISVLSMADCLLQLLVTSQTAKELAETLCGTGFIQLILELKATFPGSVEGASDLCSVGDQLLVKLCTTLEGSKVRVPYIREALQQALPSLSGAPTDCLQVLTQRSQLPGRTTPSSLQSAQAAVLCLLCTAHTHGNQLVPASDLLRALDMFLSLNPDLHLLPPTTLSHITVLYAIASYDVTSCLNGSDISSNRISGLAILTRGVQRVTDPTSLFVPHVSLMSWSLHHWGGGSDITRAWMQQWISLAHQSQSQAENLSLLLETSHPSLQCVLGLISAPSSDDGVGVATILELLEHLLVNSRENSSLWVTMYKCLNRIILEQRVHPLPDDSYGALLKLLAMTQKNKDCADLTSSDIKLTYHIANLVCRVGVVFEDGTASTQGRLIAQCGLEILSVCVDPQSSSSSQTVRLLLSNQSLLHKLSTLLPRDSKAKTHNLLSAVVMEFITLLIAANDVVKGQSIPLSAQTLMSALLSPLPRVQIAGLNVWRKIFSRGDVASPFIVQGVGQHPLRQLRTLTFLIMNCSANGNVGVAETAANCFVELTKYSHSLDKCKKGILSPWCLVLLRHSVDMYESSILPLHRVTCLQQILQFLSLESEFKDQPHTLYPTLRSLGQLLYNSLMTVTSGNDSSCLAQNLTSCLKQMQQWISLAHQSQSQAESLSLLLETSHLALQCVLGLISAPSSDDGVGVATILELLEHLLVNSRENSSLWVTMYKCVNRIILEQRVYPLPDDSYGALLKLLAMTQKNKDCSYLTSSDIKLTYHIANLVCRVGVVFEDGTASTQGRLIAQCGLEILSVCVDPQSSSSSQTVRLLLSNQSLLHKLSTLLPRDSKAKTHNLLSAVVMEFITLLIAANDVVKGQSIPLSAQTLMSALLSPLPRVQIAGLNVWRKIFSRGDVASPFIVQGVGQHPLRQLRTLTFLIMNCSANGNVGVAETAANCFVELTKYSHSLDKCKKGILSPWCLVLLRHSVDMYESSILPLHRITCLQQILQFLSLESEFKGQPHTLHPTLRSLGQLLYNSLMTVTSGNDSSCLAQNLTSCLKQIARLDRGCLEEQQWIVVKQYDM